MKFKITIGEKVFEADKDGIGYQLLDTLKGPRYFSNTDLEFLGAKIEKIEPFRFEADVTWELRGMVVPVTNSIKECNHEDGFVVLIGKRGKLVFIEGEK